MEKEIGKAEARAVEELVGRLLIEAAKAGWNAAAWHSPTRTTSVATRSWSGLRRGQEQIEELVKLVDVQFELPAVEKHLRALVKRLTD